MRHRRHRPGHRRNGGGREPFTCALLTFTLNTAAYQAEIYRGAVRSLPRGRWEAAAALGPAAAGGILAHRCARRRSLAQAARQRAHPDDQASAIASVITVFDLMGQTRVAFSGTFDLTIYLYAAVLYLALVELIRRLWDRLGRG